MIIDCISDLHGHYPKLDGGDLLIIAGDLTAAHTESEYSLFDHWLKDQNYGFKIVIAGNHDQFIPEYELSMGFRFIQFGTYLCDSGCGIPDLKIWGSPWTKTFPGINPASTAFTLDHEADLKKKWDLIPDDTDILITHSPPWGIRDCVIDFVNGRVENVGSTTLLERVKEIKPMLHVFGHIHEGYGEFKTETHFVNASHVNERYKPVNKPIRVIL